MHLLTESDSERLHKSGGSQDRKAPPGRGKTLRRVTYVVQFKFKFISDSIQIQFRFYSIYFRSPYTYIVNPILYVL
ncbi:hypothetical protein VN97_g12018 [Penicillium thymicola]|uniref:Uncharacterized protein n=1 Tax=Penicillium thymicola TaxID=293382 RepID=A0AAI9T682_PENTH|nr:hypothetical protein VN97_g12018 [Penicillium thymicola]